TGQVAAADYFEVKNHLFEITDARYDLDGDGQVLALDYFVVKNHLFWAAVPKPNP
ncbi:MAG: dockerin type I domain-containing protein, partial [Phycisphaerae bacterium]